MVWNQVTPCAPIARNPPHTAEKAPMDTKISGAQLNSSRGNAQRFGDYLVWLLFDERERGRDLQFRR